MRYAIEYTAGNGKRYTEYANTAAEAEATRARIIADYAAVPGMSAHADGVTVVALSDAPHAPAPDRGRNVHCVCGAEFSLARNLMAHVTLAPGTRTTFRRAVYNVAGDTVGHRYSTTRDESALESVRAWNRDNITPATPRYDRAATVSEWSEVTA